MSHGGHDNEPSNFPALTELADLQTWAGPSSKVEDLAMMQAMVTPVGKELQSRPQPEDMTPEIHQRRTRNAQAMLHRVDTCLDALLYPEPPGVIFNFAEIVRLTGVWVRDETFNKMLDRGEIDQLEYDELMEDLLQAATDVCTAFDTVMRRHALPRQRTAQLILGAFVPDPHIRDIKPSLN